MKRETKKQLTLDRLVEAALRLFATQGYEATTVAQITREAGVAKGTFFNYFSTKEDVLLKVSDMQQSWVVEQVSMMQAEPGPLAPRLIALMERLVERMFLTPALVRAMFLTTLARVGDQQVVDHFAAALVPLFTAAQETGEFTQRFSSQAMAELTVQTYFVAMLRWRGDTPLSKVVGESLDAVLYGIVNRPGSR